METAKPNRTREKNLVIRLLDEERAELDAVAQHERLSASDIVRRAIRAEFQRLFPAGLPKKKGGK